MIHPHTELRWINEQIGFGVFATRAIPAGTIVWAMDSLDQRLSPDKVESLPSMTREAAMKYMFRDSGGHYVLCWDYTRYVNHSFHPTCMMTPLAFDLAVVDIEAGRELTGDYGMLNIVEPFQPFHEPGAGREVVMPDDLASNSERWDALLAQAFHRIPSLPQPLREVVDAADWSRALRICAGAEPLPSLKSCLWNE